MSKAQALNRPTTCGAEIDRRARRDEQPPCQASKKHQSGNARRVSIRARRLDSCAPCVDACAPCVDACAPCVDSCLRFSCKTVGRPPFGTYRPSPLERIAPHPRPQLPRIAPPPRPQLERIAPAPGQFFPIRARTNRHGEGRIRSASAWSARPLSPSQKPNQEPFHVHRNHHTPRHWPAHHEPDDNPTHHHSDSNAPSPTGSAPPWPP